MKKWIRWQGLIAFVVVVGGLAALWILFIDGLVKAAIEKVGSSIVGAEVNVNADVRLVPFSVTLRNLQVTNPEAPNTNSIQCGRIAFSLDSLNLLRRKVIIREMAAEGLRFDTPRKRPGWVEKREEEKKDEKKETGFNLPVQIPDIKTILQNENLESPKLVETAKADVQKMKGDWKKRTEEMPSKTTLDGYKARTEKFKKARRDVRGLAEQLSEVRELKRDIEQDLDRVKQARRAFKTDFAAAKDLIERAEQAPMNDVRRLRDKYGISPAGLSNMSQLLFGDQVAGWVRTGLLWYNRLQPVVERAKAQKKEVTVVKPVRGAGVDVRFKEYRPLPDFLIDRIAVSAETEAGALAGTIKNITPDQNILGVPLTFALSGEKLKAAQSIAINGVLNHIQPAKPEDTARFMMRGFRVQNLVLSGSKDLPVALQDALVDFDLNGSFTQTIKGTFTANINSARMSVGGQDSNRLIAAVRSSLAKVTSFSLTADIAGTLQNYSVNLSSDLDRVLKNAVGSVLQEQSAKLEQQLKASLQEKTGAQLKELRESFSGLNEMGSRLESVQKQLDSLLEEAVKSAAGGKKLRLP